MLAPAPNRQDAPVEHVHAAGWLLGGNMLFLWVFGDNVEHRAGPLLYLLIYLVSGLVGRPRS